MRYGYGSTADFKVYLYPYGGWLRNPAPVDGQNPIIYRVEKPSKVSLPILVPNHTFLRGMSFQTSGRIGLTQHGLWIISSHWPQGI